MKKKRLFLSSLLAVGFNPELANARVDINASEQDGTDAAISQRLQLEHKYQLAGHRSHSSHSSHRSSSGGGYVPRVVTPKVRARPRVRQKKKKVPRSSFISTPKNNSNSTPPSSILPSSQKARTKTLPGNTGKFKKIVMQVQLAMQAFGYYSGGIDGVIGPQSKVALASMQKDFNLKVTGTVTPELLNVLGIQAR